MLKKTTLFGILFIAVLSSKAQTPCSADKPSNGNPKMCIYDQIKPIKITRGAASNSSHLYNYWIYSPFDPGTPPTVNPLAKVSSASSQFDPAPFLPKPLNAMNYQFWITEYDSTEKCLGKAAQVLLTVNQTTPPTEVVNDKFCQNTETIEPLSVTDILPGATVNWYPNNVSTAADSSHLGSLSTSNPYNISGIDTLASGTYTYLASQTIGGCQSNKIPVSFSINPQPAPPILIANHSCEGLAFTALYATGTEAGGTNQWYANPVLTSLLGGKSSNSYTPTTTTIPKAGVITFYATQTSAVGCISDAASVNYSLYPHPQAPIFANATQSMCATSDRVPTFTVTNVDSLGTIEWNANNSITGATYHPFIPSKETTIITAVQKGNGCVSDTSQASLIVIGQPVKPGTSIPNQTICATAKPIAFIAQGMGTNGLKWYLSQSDIGTANYSPKASYLPTSYAIPAKDGDPDAVTSFFVTQTVTSDTNHCEGIPQQVNLTVKSKPIKPSFTSDSIITTCAYNSNVAPLTLNSNINSFEWFNYKTNTEITSSDGTVKGIHSNSYTPNPDSLLPNSIYKIIVREFNAAGCMSDSIIGTYKITDCIDNSTIVGIAKLSVSPNPVLQLLRVKISKALTGIGTIKLFNIYGALVYEKSEASVTSVDETISVVSLPSGIYTVVLETDQGAVSELVEVIR
jgi:hypothetical protein